MREFGKYALTAAALCGPPAFMAWAVRGRAASVFAPSVWRGDRSRPEIAITFDDGPSESTAAILDMLARYRAPATFFQCGANVARLPQVAREVRAAGHEIGNHTYNHPLLCFHSSRFMEQELRLAQEVIAEHAGVIPTWFRAPFGARWPGLGAVQRQVGLTGMMWTVIGYDWKRNADGVVEHLSRRVSNGAILCLHDGRELRARPDIGVTVDAVRRIVPVLLDRGYRFETVSRLLCPMNSTSAS
jgi:peptidoglycan/xylan/chitin deacetylase (PgdA/CDA1 family)